MINYKLEIQNGTAVVTRLRAGPEKLQDVAYSTLDAWAKETAAWCIANKLSGDPLNRRSGRLSRSVHGLTERSGQLVSGVIGAGADVPYAGIQEYGGDIFPHKAKALSWVDAASGQRIFAKHVHITEKAYMRSTLTQRAPDGIAALKAATLALYSP